MATRGALRTVVWTVALTIVATALVFAFDADPRPWPGRYGDWLAAMARFEFVPDGREPGAWIDLIGLPYSVVVTLTVGVVACAVTVMIALVGALRRRERTSGAGRLAIAMAPLTLLGWLTMTLGSVADRLNGAAGAELVPTTVSDPFPVVVGQPPALSPLEQWHQLLLPAVIVTVVLAPVVLWWCGRVATGSPQDAIRAVLRAHAIAVPAFVVVAVLVELATTYAFGAGLLLVGRALRMWFDDATPNAATAVLLLGLAAAATTCWLAVGAALVDRLPGRTAAAADAAEEDGEAESPEAPEAPEAPEPRADEDGAAAPARRWWAARTPRAALLTLAAIALAVCYSWLWFDVGPRDIVSTDAPQPPSAGHWLGVDARGHDQLARLAAATVGTTLVVAGAAAIATVAALAALPARRLATAVAALAAVGAAGWLLAHFGDPMLADLTEHPPIGRGALTVALGALVLPLAVSILSRRPVSPQRVVGAWLAACAAAIAAEQLATLVVVRLDDRSTTLGAELAATLAYGGEAYLGIVGDPAFDAPWLWHPPAVVATALVVATTLLAGAALADGSGHPEAQRAEATSRPAVPESTSRNDMQ